MVLSKLLHLGEGRKAKQLLRIADAVLALEEDVAQRTDAELRANTDGFRQRLAEGVSLGDLQVEAFAVVRETAWRVLRQKPFPVQVFGACALHDGNIAEMKTGEGKTLTSTMPVYLNALEGKGVHVVTVNDYLAGRDAEWMGAVHRFLGLEVGLVQPMQDRDAKRKAYAADITYGTNNEFGFDYLRDNMAWNVDQRVQRGHRFALIDEVDSILVDEARTPLIISGPAEQSAQWYQIFARRVVPNLQRGEEIRKPGGQTEQTGDYVVDEAKRTVAVTEDGVAKVERILGIDNLYESVHTPLVHHLLNALKAKDLYKRDVEYLVRDGEVKIVDEHTGRVLEGRRYSEGLHQAIEAKEGVRIKEENQTLATITLQNYYRMYDKLAGMTGTAKTEELEFQEIYKLGVVVVPTNRPIIRDDRADLIYKSEKAKFDAVVDDIVERHEKGQPVLVGTVSIEKSERLSEMLRRRGIPHKVLNAKHHEKEAHIIAQAGRKAAVTVATNMAGRGVDIILGGNPEEMAKDDVARLGTDPDPDEAERVLREALERYETHCRAEREEVLERGGLYVLGTERHESRRIDNQLRGRSGRQGDPGESRFYLSLEDDLMRLFNAEAVERIMTRLRVPETVPIEHKLVTRAVGNAQRQVESRNFDIRKNVLKYDDVMNKQREVVYVQRQKLLEGDPEQVEDIAANFIEEAVRNTVDLYAPQGVFPEEWDLAMLQHDLEQVYPVGYDIAGIDLEAVDRERLVDDLIGEAFRVYEQREQEVGSEVMRELERRIILSIVDRRWREHLYEMDALRDGIGLRAVGQRDPLTEYQREAYDGFVAMMHAIRQEAATYFFHVPIKPEEAAAAPARVEQPAVAGPADEPGRDAPAHPSAAAASSDHETVGAPSGNGQAETEAAADAAGVKLPELPSEESEADLTYVSSTSSSPRAHTPAGGAQPTARDGAAEPAGRGPTVRQLQVGGQRTVAEKVGRNDPCPCGSGKKFKRCHGA
ncbi:MAG TPA: preprotein translocase subunit SecA [Nitriliruptorales bacterium]|nr:preprotein translocase subunit SecA [Nitriliruptorales bacterium]